jgi:CIC family chloride channel protein
VHYFIKNRNPILNIDKLHFDYYNASSLLYICLFSLAIGVICFAFFTSFISLFNNLNKYKYKDAVVIIMGVLLSFMIHKFGVFIIGSNEDVINEGFKNASSTTIFGNGSSLSSSSIKAFNLQNVIGKIINCIISLGSGLSGGIIIPSMTIGSGLGALYSKILSYAQLGLNMPIENIMYIGMVAFLSPMLDAPITSAIVINQISKQSFNTIPISLLSSFISYYTYKTLHSH